MNPAFAMAIMDIGARTAMAVAAADLQTVVAVYMGEIEELVARALGDPNPYPLLKEIEQELRRPTKSTRRPTKDSDYRELADAVRRLMRFF